MGLCECNYNFRNSQIVLEIRLIEKSLENVNFLFISGLNRILLEFILTCLSFHFARINRKAKSTEMELSIIQT